MTDIPSHEEARAEIEARWRADYEEALDREARRKVAKAEAREQRTAAAAARAAARRRAIEQEHKDARKAYRRLYGDEIASKLDPDRRYDLIEIGDQLYACDPARSDRIVRSASRWLAVERGAVAVAGIRLGALAPTLAGVDPGDAELRQLARKQAKAAREERDRYRESLTDRDRTEEERERYGVAVSDLPDPGTGAADDS